MIKFVKGLLSSDKIVSNGISALDSMVLTKEEKTEYFLKYLEATVPMNVSRRFMAMVITMFWLFNGVIMVVLLLSGRVEEFAVVSQFASVYVMPPFTVIVGFYFFKSIKK